MTQVVFYFYLKNFYEDEIQYAFSKVHWSIKTLFEKCINKNLPLFWFCIYTQSQQIKEIKILFLHSTNVRNT